MDRDYALGTSICLRTPAGARLATCGMVLNNTSWSISATPCVVSARPPLEHGLAAMTAVRERTVAVADR
jgi:hypothetical protein